MVAKPKFMFSFGAHLRGKTLHYQLEANTRYNTHCSTNFRMICVNLCIAQLKAFNALSSMLCGWCRYRHVNSVWANECPSNQDTRHAYMPSIMPIISDASNPFSFILLFWKFNKFHAQLNTEIQRILWFNVGGTYSNGNIKCQWSSWIFITNHASIHFRVHHFNGRHCFE